MAVAKSQKPVSTKISDFKVVNLNTNKVTVLTSVLN